MAYKPTPSITIIDTKEKHQAFKLKTTNGKINNIWQILRTSSQIRRPTVQCRLLAF